MSAEAALADAAARSRAQRAAQMSQTERLEAYATVLGDLQTPGFDEARVPKAEAWALALAEAMASNGAGAPMRREVRERVEQARSRRQGTQ